MAIQFSDMIVGVMRLGDWGAKLTSEELERFIDGCLDLGLRDFDHADIYGGYTAESDFGKVLQRIESADPSGHRAPCTGSVLAGFGGSLYSLHRQDRCRGRRQTRQDP